jgi:hypothetical protein
MVCEKICDFLEYDQLGGLIKKSSLGMSASGQRSKKFFRFSKKDDGGCLDHIHGATSLMDGD